MDDIKQNGINDGDIAVDVFELASDTCLKSMPYFDKKNIFKIFNNYSSPDMAERIEDIFSASIEYIVKSCSGIIRPGKWNCAMGFSKILTENGLCMTFNMLSRSDLIRKNM